MGFEEGVRCLLVRIPQWGFCRRLHVRFRVAAHEVRELAHGLRACEGGGLEESLPAPWGVFRVYFRGIGLGCHEDSVCAVEDPPLGVRFEGVDGGLWGGRVQGVPQCDG